MAQAIESGTVDTTAPSLEVDGLELVDRERLVLTGRWSGVRGRRFMRPTLTFLADGRSHRVLADLRDKPWAAEEGAPWRASFPWPLEGTDVSDAELSVATDIVIPVQPPGSLGGSAQGQPPRRRSAASEIVHLRRRVHALEDELAAARTREQRLREELQEASEAGVEATAAIARRDAALEKLEQIVAERDGLARSLREASAERSKALRELESSRADRDQSARAGSRAVETLEDVRAQRDEAAGRVQALQRERQRLNEEREWLQNERRRLERERRTLEARLGAVSESAAPGAEPVRTHSAEPVRTHSVEPVVPAVAPRATRQRISPTDWNARVAAFAVLLAFILALALVLRII